MTSPEHVQCIVVNDVLQHLATLGTATPEPPSYRPDLENKINLSGVVLRAANVTSAAIGFHQDPDSTRSLVLSEPIFVPDALAEISRGWFRQLLSATIDHAKQHDFAQIRFLEWDSLIEAMPWIPQELVYARFAAPVPIIGWRTTAREYLRRPGPVANVRLSTAELLVPNHGLPIPPTPAPPSTNHSQASNRCDEIAEALDRILDNTDDLTALAAPRAMELLQKWSTQECTLLVAEAEMGVVGLCAFAFKPSRDGDSAASGQIEYLGVRKDLQRQGIATQMVSYLCRGVSSDSDQTIEITAFADESNLPANSFYRQSGFAPLCRGKLWYREANTDRKQKEPS